MVNALNSGVSGLSSVQCVISKRSSLPKSINGN